MNPLRTRQLERRIGGRRGITLLELLAVIAMAAVMIGIAAPIVGSMRTRSQTESGRNAASAATKAVRGFATQGGPNLGAVTGGNGFSGVAMIFTPQQQIRLVENTQTSVYDNAGTPAFVEALGLNDYTDIPDRDYVNLPKGLGVAGLVRLSDGSIELVAPPFAVVFNERGQIVHSPYSDRNIAVTNYMRGKSALVHYDGNYDNEIAIESAADGRWRGNPHGGSATYDMYDWDPTSENYVANDDTSSNPGFHPDENKYKLPFETIESVVGVIMFNRVLMEDAIGRSNQPFNHDATVGGHPVLRPETRNWILENGEPLFVSPYTGQLVRMPETEE